MRFLHIFTSKFCRKNLIWRRNVLYCRKCGRPAALRYMLNGELQLYIYPEFSDMTHDIIAMPSTKQIVHADDYLGIISLDEWYEFIAGMKQDIARDFAAAIDDLNSIAYTFDEEDDADECTD